MTSKKILFWPMICYLLLPLLSGCRSEDHPAVISTDYRPDPKGQPGVYSILSVNVGNSSLACRNYAFKLCQPSVRDRIAANIQKLQPDIILLQELLGAWQCQPAQFSDPASICYQLDHMSQARQLVGEDYTIALNDRNHHEAIAIRKDIGQLVGIDPGGEGTARTAPGVSNCNDGFTITAATVKLNSGFEFDIVDAHPNSRDTACRAAMVDQIFSKTGLVTMIEREHVLIAGDFNLDPWRDKDESVTAWQNHLNEGWAGRDFRYHSGVAEIEPPRYTFNFLFLHRTLDLMVSNFAHGTVLVLGESSATQRLDGGWGMDHRALFGWLQLEPVEKGG